MASADTLCRKLLRVKNCVVESCDIYNDKNGVAHLRMKARPNAWHQDDCPFCGKRRPGYDRPTKRPKVWRGLVERIIINWLYFVIPLRVKCRPTCTSSGKQRDRHLPRQNICRYDLQVPALI